MNSGLPVGRMFSLHSVKMLTHVAAVGKKIISDRNEGKRPICTAISAMDLAESASVARITTLRTQLYYSYIIIYLL